MRFHESNSTLPTGLDRDPSDWAGARSLAKPAPHWTDQVTTRPDCPNCGAPRSGAFCAECGQKLLTERLKMRELLRGLLRRLTSVEAGLFHTFWNLCLRPGRVARDYVSGKQRPYVNPLTYFFLAATAQILAFLNVKDTVRSLMMAQFAEANVGSASTPEASEGIKRIEQLLGSTLNEALVDSYFSALTQGYSYSALIFYAIPFAFLLWLLHRWRGESYCLGETMVFALYSFSQMLFITAACSQVTIKLGNAVHLAMAFTVYLGISQLAHGDFFSRTWTARLLTLIATFFAMVPFLASIVGLFLISFLSKLFWASFTA